MTGTIWEFFTLANPNVRVVVAGSVLLGIGSAVTGVFGLLRKRALAGDAVAHALLPGICFSFLLTGDKHPVYLFIGALISGWISLLSIDAVSRYTKLKEDAGTGIVLSVFFGLGILLLTIIQHSGSDQQSGLDKFIFGRAASMSEMDLLTIGIGTLSILLVVLLYYRPLKVFTFDASFAASIGYPLRTLSFLLSTLTVVAIAVGIQAVGVVMMAALLFTPALAARYWTNRLSGMLVLAGLFGGIAAWSGSFVSYLYPSMPTGPWIVLFLTGITTISIAIAPAKGIIAGWRKKQKHQRKILRENLLKTIHKISNSSGDSNSDVTLKELLENRWFEEKALQAGLRDLLKKKLVSRAPSGKVSLTTEGRQKATEVIRLHKLWELYLTKKMNLAPDHVKNNAEAMEHILDNRVVRLLEEELVNSKPKHPLK